MAELTEEQVNKYFTYDEETGHLIWKVHKGGKARIGDIAGCIDHEGYRRIRFDGGSYRAHRLVFLLHRGYLPEILDHINNDRSDNRIENLRAVTANENAYNRSINAKSISGVKGISWDKVNNCWLARIQTNKKRKHIGNFDNLKLAEEAMVIAREALHGSFANHGGTV